MEKILINWAPFIVLIGMYAFFMVGIGRKSQNQKKQMEDYIKKTLEQVERLTVAVEKIADKMEKKD